MGLGSWLVCAVMLVGNDGVKRDYLMNGQVMLEATDGVNLWVDISSSLMHYDFKQKPSQPMMINAKKCYRDWADVKRKREFPENDG